MAEFESEGIPGKSVLWSVLSVDIVKIILDDSTPHPKGKEIHCLRLTLAK